MTVPATRLVRRSPAARFWALLGFLLFSTFGIRLYAYDVTVAKDGSGNYTTIQAAVTAAPTARTTAYTIYIKDGIYTEKVTVPSNKPFLQFVGQSVANTILTWNDNALTPNGSGGTVGTGGSGSIVVNATDFSALTMTFVNSFGDGSQAVAVSLYADRAAFKNCRFLGNQDTLLTYESGNAVSRHYFKDCYIDGNVDFIFGNAIAVFDNCVIYAKTRVVNAATSYITAANTPATQTYGYLFRNAKIPSNNGTTLYYLGRPWQNSTGFSTAAGTLANNKVIFSKTKIGVNEIQPAGWVVWDTGTDPTKITFGEFQTRYFDGHLVNTSQRVSWSQQLTPTDTLNYTIAKMFGLNTGTAATTGSPVSAAWDPTAVAAGFGSYSTPDIAVSNLQATKGTSQTAIQWNISWAMAGIQYALQRSSDNVTFATINTQTAATDSLYNFSATDALPAAGSAYYYRVVASKAGLATHTTPSVQVSSIPTITASTASLSAFTQYGAAASAIQTYTVSAVNLTANLTITPPAGFEVSANGGTNWYSSTSPLVLTPTANTLASTTISVRLNAAATGAASGNIAHTSAGATTVNVAVTGSRVAGTAPQSDPLQWWPLIRGTQDSTAIRSAQLVATTPTLRRLYVSNGTTVSTIPAYSTKFGQAFGPSADGSGTWSLVGGNLSRGYYEQFTVTASATGSVRVDSVLVTSAFYNTSSNTKLAVVYSKSGFASDSTDVSAGTGPGLSSTAYGAFGAPIALPNQTTGPTNVYHLALNGSTGVTLTAGQTLTFRLYFSCGSSSAGRYGLLKNVVVKGAPLVACNAAFSYSAAAFCKSTTTNPAPTITGTTGGAFSSATGLVIDAATGVINLSTSTAGTYTVTYTASAGCLSTQGVTITAAPLANIGYGAASYCTTTTGTVALGIGTGSTLGTITVNPTMGLTIAANGAITPSTSTPGTYFITNTVAASGGCAAVTGGTTVSIAAPATAGFAYPTATACAGTATTLTPTLSTGATAGTFSLPTATGLSINAATGVVTVAATAVAGTYTVTNTVAAAGGCAAVTSTASFTLTAPTTATFSYAGSPFCKSSTTNPAPTITGTAGGTFSSTTGLSINASTGAINLSASTAGTYVVTYTVSGACGSSSTQSVTITAAPVAGFSYPAATYCVSGTTSPAVVLGTGAAAGTFTSTTGLTLNASTGAITLSTSTPGTYTVTNTIAPAGGCAAVTATATVAITAAPVAGFSYATPGTGAACAGGTGTFAPVLATGATAGTFSSTTGLTLNATTGVISLAGSTAGTYTVTNTVAASGGCAAVTSTATFTVNPVPATPTLTTTGTPATGITLTSSSATGNQFYLGGVLIPGATGQTYLINSGTKNGSYTVVVTNASGCSSAPSVAVNVTVTPTIAAQPATTLTVYPNPTPTGQLTLELGGYREAVQLTISNALGQRVHERTLAPAALSSPQVLDLSALPAGVYVLQARTASGSLEVRRIVRE
jgi:pectin methylesterase-like acyl-CoA thioesterase